MEQNIGLLKNAVRKASRQTIKQSLKAEQYKKILPRIIRQNYDRYLEPEKDITEFPTQIQKMIENLKKLFKQKEETIFNQSCKIRELTTNINENNNQTDILKRQFIKISSDT